MINKIPHWGTAQIEGNTGYFAHKHNMFLTIQDAPFIYNREKSIPVKEMKAISLILKDNTHSFYIKPELGLMWGFTKLCNAHQLGLKGETYWVATDGFRMIFVKGQTTIDNVSIHPDIVPIASNGNFDFVYPDKKTTEIYFNTKWGYGKVTYKTTRPFPDVDSGYVVPKDLGKPFEFTITGNVPKDFIYYNDINLGYLDVKDGTLILTVEKEPSKGGDKLTCELATCDYPDINFIGINVSYLKTLLEYSKGLWTLKIADTGYERITQYLFFNQDKTIFGIIMGMHR